MTTVWKSLLFCPLLGGVGLAQSTPPPTLLQLSPRAAYEEAMRPLDITRRSIPNWSDSELEALKVAIRQAGVGCGTRTPEQFTGDDLIDLARLCAVGLQWPVVVKAAARYINSTDQSKPQPAQAYAYLVNAAMNVNDAPRILSSSLAMLRAVPYDSLTDATMYGALHYLQLAYAVDARTLYAAREPIILKMLQSMQPAPTASNPESAPVPIHALYADGVAFAAFEQFEGTPEAAANILTQLNAALPATLAPDDAIPVADTRRQYALIGAPLPHIPLTVSLFSPTETPHINPDYGSTTILLLFPEWCAQCVRMAEQIGPTLFRTSDNEVHIYGLLAQPPPPAAILKPAKKTSLPTETPKTPPDKTTAEQLRGTPTLIVPPETLNQFASTDFPLLIALDPKGIVRFIQPASENALNEGDFLDQIAMRIREQWPKQPREERTAATPAH